MANLDWSQRPVVEACRKEADLRHFCFHVASFTALALCKHYANQPSVSTFCSCRLAIASALTRIQTSAATRPEFDVASIKPSNEVGGIAFGVGNGAAGERGVTLRILIGLAYRRQEFQISGGPGWISSARFNVEAKAADRNADPDQLRIMLQSLLADRFKLKLHPETKQSSVYALVIANEGARIKLSSDQTSPDINGAAAPGAGPNRGAIRLGAGSLIGNAVPLSLFVRFLSQRLDRAVVDRTQLKGRFDLRLQWTPGVGDASLDPSGEPVPPADPSEPSIFTAIQEQLGLRLESTKGPVDCLVIDHAEKPTSN